MMTDIQNRKDIHLIITLFYDKLLADCVVKHFFEDIVAKNYLTEHIDTVTDFWNGILFQATDYKGNAMRPHLLLNRKKPFEKQHFKRWLHLFHTTIDENFTGQKAEMAKTRALSIATIMEIKIHEQNKLLQ